MLYHFPDTIISEVNQLQHQLDGLPLLSYWKKKKKKGADSHFSIVQASVRYYFNSSHLQNSTNEFVFNHHGCKQKP